MTNPAGRPTLTLTEVTHFAEHTGCSMAEVSELLGITEPAIRKCLDRAERMDLFYRLQARGRVQGRVKQGRVRS